MKRLLAVWLALYVDAQPTPTVWAIGHRGFMAAAPENTLASFAAAVAAGADYLEVDVRPAKDGTLVLMHDATVDRTTNGHGAVADLTWDQLRQLDAGRGTRIPTFREALQWAKDHGARVDVDHKAGTVEAVAAAIRETGMVERVVVEGSRERLARFAELLPGVDTMPKVKSVEEVREVCGALRTTVVRLSLEQLADRRFVDATRQCGARVAVTLLGQGDTESEIRRVIGLGAQLLETDHVDWVAKVRDSR